ncbi:hypothetical protein [Actinoplanes sp. NPDC051851]|uniref:hypothetical protein n=1 Tax=Actinoplanes sp. NPDC051851 TaxID=3154753 RepID=UPI00341C7F2E
MHPLPYRAAVVAATAALIVVPATAGWAAADQPPAVPTSLSVSGVACTSDGIWIGTTTPQASASFTDPDLGAVAYETLTPEFSLQPEGAPDQAVTWTATALTYPGRATSAIPATLADGGRYLLTARATDAAGAASDWSPACLFTVDTNRPYAPVVTSTDYPAGSASGGVGVTGRFTFAAAGGDQDVVKFRYSGAGTTLSEVAADESGRATVDITPASYGINTLTVQAVDRTGNRSAETAYGFTVIDRDPRVIDLNSDAGVGEPRTIRFWSAVPGTVSFTYSLNGAPATTVDADADGWSTVTLTPDRRGDNLLTVTSRTASGEVSPQITTNLYVSVHVPAPEITSPDFPDDGTPPPAVGDQVTISLRTDSPEVTEFVYSVDFGATEQVVTADENGNATFTYTIEWEYLEVQARARTADGFESNTVTTGWEVTIPSS